VKSKHQKRVEGEERNEAWRSLTPLQKVIILSARPGNSKRQLSKLGTPKEG